MRNVHVIDQRLFGNDRTACDSFCRTLERLPGTNLVFQVNAGWSVHRICDRARRGSVIGVLRIYCHGNAGWMQLAGGLSQPMQTRDFQLLRGYWAGGHPRLEIQACAVASSAPIDCHGRTRATVQDLPQVCTPGVSAPNSAGQRLVQSIADNAGVMTVAALNAQLPTVQGYEGPVIYCRPARYYLFHSPLAI